MLWLLKKITDRLKSLLVASAATDLEAEFLLRQTERKAELLRHAHEYEEQGFGELADELRRQALELSHESPLSRGLTLLATLQGDPAKAEPAKLNSPDDPYVTPGTTGNRKTKKAKATRKRTAR